METTQLTLSDPKSANKYKAMIIAASVVPDEIRNATLTSATWVKVHYAASLGHPPIDGVEPDDRDDIGLWLTKVYPCAEDQGGFTAKRVMIPWSAIRQIEILAVELTDQPF